MDRKRIAQAAVSVFVGGGATVYLLISGVAAGDHYKHVDEVVGALATWQGKRLQVHGRVVAGSMATHPRGAQVEYQFEVEHNGKRLGAHYVGEVPDTFRSGTEVVCKGMLTNNGTLEVARDGIMAKCPSKYEVSPADRRP